MILSKHSESFEKFRWSFSWLDNCTNTWFLVQMPCYGLKWHKMALLVQNYMQKWIITRPIGVTFRNCRNISKLSLILSFDLKVNMRFLLKISSLDAKRDFIYKSDAYPLNTSWLSRWSMVIMWVCKELIFLRIFLLFDKNQFD